VSARCSSHYVFSPTSAKQSMLKVYYTLKKHAALLQPRYRLSFVQAVHSCAADDTMEYIEYTMQGARDPNALSRPWRQDGHCV